MRQSLSGSGKTPPTTVRLGPADKAAASEVIEWRGRGEELSALLRALIAEEHGRLERAAKRGKR